MDIVAAALETTGPLFAGTVATATAIKTAKTVRTKTMRELSGRVN